MGRENKRYVKRRGPDWKMYKKREKLKGRRKSPAVVASLVHIIRMHNLRPSWICVCVCVMMAMEEFISACNFNKLECFMWQTWRDIYHRDWGFWLLRVVFEWPKACPIVSKHFLSSNYLQYPPVLFLCASNMQLVSPSLRNPTLMWLHWKTSVPFQSFHFFNLFVLSSSHSSEITLSWTDSNQVLGSGT